MKAADVSIATCKSLSPATRFGQTGHGIWVLDGEEPESPAYHLDRNGDEVWYVETFDRYLKSSLAEQTPLPELVKEGIFHISDAFARGLGETKLDVEFFPAASIALLRFDLEAETLEYFTIGDAGLIIEFDEDVYRICANDGVVNDSHRNVPDWFLAFAHETVQFARQGALPLEEVSAVHLFTGEFEECRLDLDPVYSWDELLDWMNIDGVGTVLQHVEENRTIQMGEKPQRLALSSVLFPQRRVT